MNESWRESEIVSERENERENERRRRRRRRRRRGVLKFVRFGCQPRLLTSHWTACEGVIYLIIIHIHTHTYSLTHNTHAHVHSHTYISSERTASIVMWTGIMIEPTEEAEETTQRCFNVGS